MKVQRVIYNSEIALSFFLKRNFDFMNFNFIDLNLAIPKDEKSDFSLDQKLLCNKDFFKFAWIMAMQVILKESLDDLPKARRRRFYVVLVARLIHVMTFVVGLLIAIRVFPKIYANLFEFFGIN